MGLFWDREESADKVVYSRTRAQRRWANWALGAAFFLTFGVIIILALLIQASPALYDVLDEGDGRWVLGYYIACGALTIGVVIAGGWHNIVLMAAKLRRKEYRIESSPERDRITISR